MFFIGVCCIILVDIKNIYEKKEEREKRVEEEKTKKK